MRISVVTPSFNMAPYLEDTIKSVLANLGEGDEYFVIDGGSTDGSVDIIRRYEDRITGWVSEPDQGYADAIGKGFERATGDILCWINASDIYLAGALDNAHELMVDGVDLIYGDNFYIDESSDILFFSRGWAPDLGVATFYGGWTPLQETCFWRRQLYNAVGGIDSSLQYAADYDLFLRMSLSGRTRYVPMTFSGFRRHSGQKSIAGSNAYQLERWKCRDRELERHASFAMMDALRRWSWRVLMSVRSRLAPFLWRRPDLRGTSVRALPSSQYWPR